MQSQNSSSSAIRARPAQESDAVARFLAEVAEPMRAQQPQIDATRPSRLPSGSRLLAEALAARRIRVRKVTEGRWTFQFAGSTIGGYAHGVTTLVPAHARRVLADPYRVRALLDLMEVPHPIPMVDEPRADATPPLFGAELLAAERPQSSVISLRAYVVGQQAVSVLAVVEQHAEQTLTVDVTDEVSSELSALAHQALHAIPGLLAGEVAIEVPDLSSAQEALVVGIDEAATIGHHHFPALGPGRAVADAVAEQILFTAAL